MSYSRKTSARHPRHGIESTNARVYSLIVLGASAAVCLALLLFVNLPTTGRAWTSIQNTGHYFLFATLAAVYSAQVEKFLNWKLLPKAALILVVLTIVGALAEIIQTFLPARSASSDDMWRNFAGTMTGLIGYATYHYRAKLSPLVLVLNVVILVSIFLWTCRPTIELLGYSVLKSAPPAVLHFDDPFIDSIISTSRGAETTLETLKSGTGNTTQRALRMDFALQTYSGVVFHEPGKRWGQYVSLALHIFNPDKETRILALRIHDEQHNNQYEDRFNATFNVNPGENTLLIPIEAIHSLGGKSNRRFMDMQQIKELQIFSTTKESFTLYLEGIVLAGQ